MFFFQSKHIDAKKEIEYPLPICRNLNNSDRTNSLYATEAQADALAANVCTQENAENAMSHAMAGRSIVVVVEVCLCVC